MTTSDMVGTSTGSAADGVGATPAPLVVELIGPAGVGKTTLARSLSRRHGSIAPDIDSRLSRLNKVPFVVGNALSLMPTYLRHHRGSRWFSRRETRSMAYLEAGLRLLARARPAHRTLTILDHGPIYRLAFLREFGPEITTSQPYRRWWGSLLARWAATLDMVIVLDAPDAVLLERIHTRGSWHTIKDQTEQEARQVLRRYRTAFEKTIAELLAVRRLTVLRFDTSRQSSDEIAAGVLATCAAASAEAPTGSSHR